MLPSAWNKAMRSLSSAPVISGCRMLNAHGTLAPPAGGAKVPWALSILHPEMTGALDSERIALFQADGSMDYYAKATYPDRLAPIVQHALLDGFEASGRIDAVATE